MLSAQVLRGRIGPFIGLDFQATLHSMSVELELDATTPLIPVFGLDIQVYAHTICWMHIRFRFSIISKI
jgi:hypothetical protein